MRQKDGDAVFDCYALLDNIYEPVSGAMRSKEREDRANILWHDLVDKSKPLDAELRRRLLSAALATKLPSPLVPEDWRPIVFDSTGLAESKIAADVMIFCVIEQELNATLAAFGLNQLRRRTDAVLSGRRFYKASIKSKNCGKLVVWIGLVGEARNVVCANFCRDVFEKFSVKYCCLLVGIAGGNKEKVAIGDVVGSEEVVDIEGARVEPTVSKPRHRHYPLSGPIRRMFADYEPTRWGWLNERVAALKVLEKTGAKAPKQSVNKVPKYKPGSVLTGEKLRRDGKLPSIARRFGDRFMAIEMEGSGFASSCEAKGIPWLVFRGISDYGDMKKRDLWQPVAALDAALAAKAFIVHALRSDNKVVDG
jgi:nucleoside phosphorylase